MSGSESNGISLPDIGAVSRYDAVLLVIPLSFLASGLVGQLLPVDPQAGLTLGSIVGAAAIVDALFLNPPRGPGSGRATA